MGSDPEFNYAADGSLPARPRKEPTANRKLTAVPIAPNTATLPTTLPGILSAYDRLRKTDRCVSFFSKQPDKEHVSEFWDVVGDPERNWLYVVASNPKKKARFGIVRDDPGGWAIAGQSCGIGAETQEIADAPADQLWSTYEAEFALPAHYEESSQG
jgi:hypothetical protein